ncbi:DNA recombination protein RmuC [Candidatus Persebacteraceae bacterium Df01]|jgi:DNA recombination protein RmuC|uniref:DNA recombination protein RmuC n=1 Tax=Candidatus Doriopsillibacter californiensis TaxID=2970740 RepID=A0ABT7QKC5_9GAMM|nr:DNA recombination protein RmuC [Candidatus Persebacteraceae bacterium Df01]
MQVIIGLIENFPALALSGMLLLLLLLLYLISKTSSIEKRASVQVREVRSTVTQRIDEMEVHALKEIKSVIEITQKREAKQIRLELTALTEKTQQMLQGAQVHLEGITDACRQLGANTDVKDALKKLQADTETQGMYLHDQFATIGESIRAQLQDMRDKALVDIAADSRKDRDQLQAAVASMSETVAQAVDRLTAEVDAKLALLENKMDAGIRERWSEALGSIGNLREQLSELSAAGTRMLDFGDNVQALSRILAVRNDTAGLPPARQQLSDLLAQTLPSEHYQLDAPLTNGNKAAALVRFAEPRETVVIDADLPLQTFIDSRAADVSAVVRDEKRVAFGKDVTERIHYVAEQMKGVADVKNTLLFVASEAAFADIHADHRDAVELAISRRIWLVSPTTLLAVLNTANMAIKDYRAQQQLQQISESVSGIMHEAQYFENRLSEVGDQVSAAWRSVRRAESAGSRLVSSVRGITPNTEKLPAANNNVPKS